LSKHCSDPFRAVRPIRVVLKAKTPPMTRTSVGGGGESALKVLFCWLY
jgi:hypothetical protein